MTVVSIYLARHGQTDDNLPPRRFQGQLDTPLNATGVEQAQELAERAAGLDLRAIYTSNLDRAGRTAKIVGRRVGLEPVVEPRLAEGFRGRWEGELMQDVERSEPDLYGRWIAADPEFRFPEGESLAEHRDRALAALAEMAGGPCPALVVTHGGTIRFALLRLSGLDLSHFHEPEVENATLIPLDEEAVSRLTVGTKTAS